MYYMCKNNADTCIIHLYITHDLHVCNTCRIICKYLHIVGNLHYNKNTLVNDHSVEIMQIVFV